MNMFLPTLAERLRAQFDVEVLAGWLAKASMDGTIAVLILVAFYLLWRLLDRVARSALRRAEVDATSTSFFRTTFKFALLSFAVVQALAAVGINTGALIASLGIAGLTIGFAARDSLSNLISGILIFWDRPFVINDLVEVDGQYGRVERITLRSTRIVTPDGRMLAVPNASVINSTVASYTNFPNLRLDVPVTIAVKEDVGRVRRILLDLVRNDERYMTEPPPRVVVTALNDYNFAIELQAWLKDERKHIAERFALRERMFVALTAANVDMPFETLRLEPLEIISRGPTS